MIATSIIVLKYIHYVLCSGCIVDHCDKLFVTDINEELSNEMT